MIEGPVAPSMFEILVAEYRQRIVQVGELLKSPGMDADRKLEVLRREVQVMLAESFEASVSLQFRLLGPLEPANCRSCGAPIVWVRTVNGAMAPLDARKLMVTTDDGRTIGGRESHFSSCPKRDEHRRAK